MVAEEEEKEKEMATTAVLNSKGSTRIKQSPFVTQ